MQLDNASMFDIKNAHRTNAPAENQYKSAKDFMRNVMYSVPLNKLYKVVASCNYNEKADFCPVLLEVKDKSILQHNHRCPFLLQVWTRKGEMVFERALKQPCCNWNIAGDKFMYQETPESACIYLVLLFMDKKAVIFKFTLPRDSE